MDIRTQGQNLELRKSVKGRYQDGTNEYTSVGVLMIKWENDDMNVDNEVEELGKVFTTKFGFCTEVYTIPVQNSAKRLYERMMSWSSLYDGPHALSIIYYAGHGAEDVRPNGLRVHGARNQGHGQQQGREQHAQIFINEATRPLALVNTDTLLILDCCYAAGAFSGKRIGRRKFELLSSVAPREKAVAPDYAGSFTKTLCDQLENLLEKSEEHGFTTSELYAALFWNCAGRHPFLFDQSQQNYGWIRLSPKRQEQPFEYAVAIDVRLHMIKCPDPSDLKQLASSMQYLPMVQKMDFQNLHAPRLRLDEYLHELRMANMLKPLLKRVRLRLADRRNAAKGVAESETVRGVDRNDLTPDNEDLFDWTFPGLEDAGSTSINWTDQPDSLLRASDESSAGDNYGQEDREGSAHLRQGGLARKVRNVIEPQSVLRNVLRFWCIALDFQLILLRRLQGYLDGK